MTVLTRYSLTHSLTHSPTYSVDQYTLQFNVTKIEFSARLQLVNQVVPEFLCIIPMNHHVPVDTLRINLDAPYSHVRAKLSDRNSFKTYLEDENQS